MSDTVYRVQHRITGRGPYAPGFSEVWCDPDRGGPDEWRASGIAEFGMGFLERLPAGYRVGFGFRELVDLTRWFSEAELARLRPHGFEVVVFTDAIILAESRIQCVFCRPLPFRIGAVVLDPSAVHATTANRFPEIIGMEAKT